VCGSPCACTAEYLWFFRPCMCGWKEGRRKTSCAKDRLVVGRWLLCICVVLCFCHARTQLHSSISDEMKGGREDFHISLTRHDLFPVLLLLLLLLLYIWKCTIDTQCSSFVYLTSSREIARDEQIVSPPCSFCR
jgi:hypothetical protein